MTSWRARLFPIGLAGLCLTWVGCGGGDVPDPDSDANAAPDPAIAAAPAPRPAAPKEAETPAAPAASPAPEAVVRPDAAPKAAAAPAAVVADAKAPAESEGAEAETPAPAAAQADNSSATAEMLALGNKPAAPAAESAEAAAGPGGGSAPGAPGGGAPGQPGPGGGNFQFRNSPPGAGAGPGGGPGGGTGMAMMRPPGQQALMAPGQQASMMPPGGTNDAQMKMQAAMQAQRGQMTPGAPGGAPGAPGASYGPGNQAANDAPANFRTADGAVQAFLNALRAKDLSRLVEATALRAPTEASPKNQKLFASIADESMTEDDLSEFANKLEGFNIVGDNDPTSSGKVKITLGKTAKNGDIFIRTVTVRKEKAGWKVLDISGQGVLKYGTPNPRAGQRTR